VEGGRLFFTGTACTTKIPKMQISSDN